MDASSPEVMRAFYTRLYPFKPVHAWLSRSYPTTEPPAAFKNREFAFTLKGEVYLRYQCFLTAEEFKRQVVKYNPTRFEIGPEYNTSPGSKKTLVSQRNFYPKHRELVFDIDMTDYDPIRTCCSGTDICKRCWAFISAAVRIIDNAIRDHYGYEHLLWVYSGRRGIHLWISDEEAFALDDDQRRAMINWLSVIQGSGELVKQVNVRPGSKPLHPSLQSAVEELNGRFTRIVLKDQNCFGSSSGYETLLQLIPDSKVVLALRTKWEADPTRSSEEKWEDLKAQVKKYEKGTVNRNNLTAAMEDIVLQYTYPRLDAEVSKHRNHLLKAPFCVHPKTGRVCVPVEPAMIEDFDPETVPTVGQLLGELDNVGTSGNNPDWEKTSLKPYVDILNKHNNELLRSLMSAKKEVKGEDMSW